MLIPKQGAKTYGALHIDNYLTFVGFCKFVDNDEICSVDIFLDNNKIDTIPCNKSNQKIEEIYEISGHCFEYDLDEAYCDKRHKIAFKSSRDGAELFNSPIGTMAKDEETYIIYKNLNLKINIKKGYLNEF